MYLPQNTILLLVFKGSNAGHTLEFDGIKHVLRTIPSGIFHKTIINVMEMG
jgi:adenylosuccinate synthase